MTPGDPMTGLATSLYQIAGLLVTDRTLSDGLHRAADLAVRTIEECDACTISMIVEGTPRTTAATDRAVVQLDLVQYEYDDGPCLDAARHGEIVSVEFWPIDQRYPYLASAAHVAEFSAVVSVPVRLPGAMASINLYSRAPHGFTRDPLPVGQVVAAQVALALRRSELLGQVTQLTAELQHEGDRRTSVAQAQGTLAALYECTLEQARVLLEHASEDEIRSLEETADTVLSTLRPVPPEPGAIDDLGEPQ
jgi:GAF domain-containing protein